MVRARSLSVLVNTGTTHTVCSAAAVAVTGINLYRGNTTLTGFDGTSIRPRGTIATCVKFRGQNIDMPTIPIFLPLVHGTQVILGMKYLATSKLFIHCGAGRVSCTGLCIAAATPAIPAPKGTHDFLQSFGAVFVKPIHLPPVLPGRDAEIILKPSKRLCPLWP